MLPTTAGCVIGFASDIMMFYFLMEQGEKEVRANQLRELEKLRSAEELHYNIILSRREELAKIRHDFNNQLTAALHLTENGDYIHARKLLEQMKDGVARTRENDFCENAIVDAVMAEKSAECLNLEITLDTKLTLGSKLEVYPVHLQLVEVPLKMKPMHRRHRSGSMNCWKNGCPAADCSLEQQRVMSIRL